MLLFARLVMAQDSACLNAKKADVPMNPGRSLDQGTRQLGLWVGYSPNNPTLIGRTTDRPFLEFNVQYARVLTTGDNWALKYTGEIIPVAIIRQPQQATVNGNPVDLSGRKEVYGAGLSPLGLQMNFRRGCMLQPYVNGTAGVIYFNHNVPVSNSSNFNFTFGFGTGVEIWYRENQSILLGYKYQHISNGYTAPHNPGVDSSLFYLGYAWSWIR